MPEATRDSMSGLSGTARAASTRFFSAAATCASRTSFASAASARFSADTSDSIRISSCAALASVSANGSGLSSPGRVGTAAVTASNDSSGSSA